MKDQLLAKHHERPDVICYPWKNTGQKTTMVKTFSSSLTFAALLMWEYMGGMSHSSHPQNCFLLVIWTFLLLSTPRRLVGGKGCLLKCNPAIRGFPEIKGGSLAPNTKGSLRWQFSKSSLLYARDSDVILWSSTYPEVLIIHFRYDLIHLSIFLRA